MTSHFHNTDPAEPLQQLIDNLRQASAVSSPTRFDALAAGVLQARLSTDLAEAVKSLEQTVISLDNSNKGLQGRVATLTWVSTAATVAAVVLAVVQVWAALKALP